MSAQSPKIRLRPVQDGDEAFLYEVFAATRAMELRAAGLDDAALESLLALQFRARQSQYRCTYPDASWELVFFDGKPIGYWCVARHAAEIVLVDVAFLPEFTGQGIGGGLLGGLLNEADAAGLPVLAHVDQSNPARRLYRRLGFETIGDKGPYLEIRRPPSGGVDQ